MTAEHLSSTRRLDDGHLVEVIVARSEEGGAAILALAARYRRAAVPGMVSVLSFRGDPEPVLVIELPGDESWASLPPALRSLPSAAARVATTLDHLHQRNVVHGAIDAEHLLVDQRGDPVLTGLDPIGAGRPRDDVVALATTVAAVAGDLTPRDAHDVRTLTRLVQICERTASRAEPTAAQLAAELDTMHQNVRRPARQALTMVALAVGLAGLIWGRYPTAHPTSAPQATAPPVATEQTDGASTAGSSHSTATAPPMTRRPQPPTTQAPKPPATGPPPTLRHAGRVWAVGQAGDVVTVLDWRCDQRPAVMAARPGTGEVFLWREWPVGGSEAGERVGVVPALTGFADSPVRRCGEVTLATDRGEQPLRVGDSR